jgi:hypothetical protein
VRSIDGKYAGKGKRKDQKEPFILKSSGKLMIVFNGCPRKGKLWVYKKERYSATKEGSIIYLNELVKIKNKEKDEVIIENRRARSKYEHF